MLRAKRWKHLLLPTVLTGALLLPAGVSAEAVTVQPGDSFYLIAKRYQLTVDHLKIANHLTSDTLYAGTTLYIPPKSIIYTVQSGDSLWKLAKRYGVTIQAIMDASQLSNSNLLVGQKLLIPTKPVTSGTTATGSSVAGGSVSWQPAPPPTSASKPWVDYITYSVKPGDTAWTIAIDHGIPMPELLKANNLSDSSVLSAGQALKIPVHHIPVTATPGPQYGEYLDWFQAAQYLFPVNAIATVTDCKTGKQFQVKRVTGAFHSDTEPLTAADAAKIKEVWGGQYSWQPRPVIVEVNGRRIAASMTSMPHSVDFIPDNNFPGHFDIHFLNSLRHEDGLIDPAHQACIKIAAGVN